MKKFYRLLLFFIPITYVHGNYQYIMINDDILKLKDEVTFEDQNFNQNQKIISEIIEALKVGNVNTINLCNKNIGTNVINLFTGQLEGYPENFHQKIIDLSRNQIDS